MSDENAAPVVADANTLAPVEPLATSFLSKILLSLSLILALLSSASTAYLWSLWQQDQAMQSARSPPANAEVRVLQDRIAALSSDLEQVKKALDVFKAEDEAILHRMQVDARALYESHNIYKDQIQKQLQSLKESRNPPIQPVKIKIEKRNRSKVTW